MREILAQVLSINILKDLLVPALAALAGVWLAMRKFKQERIWQEKYSAYQRVLESIEAVRYWGDEKASNVHMLPSIGWFGGKDARQFYAEAKREIAKQTSIGTVLLSEAFINRLSALQDEMLIETHRASEEIYGSDEETESAFGAHAERIRGIADRYLPQLIQLARVDLGV